MLSEQMLTEEEYKELSNRDIADDEQITFTGLELKYLVLELKDMFFSGNLNLPQAIYHAHVSADLARLMMKRSKDVPSTDTKLLR